MSYEYPSEQQLKRIKDWDIFKEGIKELISYVQSLWWNPEWGFELKGKRVLRLELHCGGWSGNESIIGALSGTPFWKLCWEKSVVGGHYYFRIEAGRA